MRQSQKLNLLPRPRRIEMTGGEVPAATPVTERIDPAIARPQGYQLRIDRSGITITGHDDAGLFYGRQTLVQLRRQYREWFPALVIEDWPDFANRGVMIDISRDKVPTMSTLFALIDMLAELKINQLQLYIEHTFAYRNHREVWKDASPMLPEEIRRLDSYCRQRHIELVPNQNSFGHFERWLKHESYEHLAEKPDGFTFPWGTKIDTGFSLNPTDPRSIAFVESLFDELLPNFTSRQFNVGCDETFDIGLGRSKAEVERRGKGRVYLDFLVKIYEAVKSRGRTMQFWADIVLHHPELIGELPRDVIALNWGYDADHPFEKETTALRDAGVPFYVCPGTSSWLSITGRTDNAVSNLRSAAASGLANGAMGYLNTDWGDLGHLQYLPVSFLPFAAGAAYSWCYEANRDIDIAAAIDAHVFHDAAGVMGRLVYDLGNVYQAVKTPMSMSTRLFWALIGGDDDRRKLWEVITREEFDEAESRVDEVVSQLNRAQMDRSDAELIKSEIRNAAAMLRYACRLGRWRIEPSSEDAAALGEEMRRIITEHRRLWLVRNRPGGLDDSVRRLEARLDELNQHS